MAGDEVLDDAALLWWSAKSEEERLGLELTCLQLGLPLPVYIFLQSEQGHRMVEDLMAETEKAVESIHAFHDALINVGIWGDDMEVVEEE